MKLVIPTERHRQVLDITDIVAQRVKPDAKAAAIWIGHTTAALTAMDLDPGTDPDFLDALDHLLPQLPWRHPHDPAHTPEHLLASLIGPDLIVPVANGRLELGEWQRLVLVEFAGPRERSLTVTWL